MILLRLTPRQKAVSPFLALNQKIAELSSEIARRIRSERELHEQREWLRVTLRSLGDAVIATDPQGRVTILNPVAERLTGWTQHEAQGQPLHEVFHIINEQTRAVVENPVEKVLREGQVVGLANHTLLISRDGRERPIDDAAAPISEHGAPLRGVVLIFRDVTERRRLERELERRAESLAEADRHKNQFLAMLSHELRNPLSAISNEIESLRTASLTGEALAESASVMARQLRNLRRMVDDLLDLSRINHGRFALKKERVALSESLRQALRVITPTAQSRRLALTVGLPETEIHVEADPTRLEQIVWNLLSNAVKYTPEGGSIAINVSREANEAVLRVRDNGIGIAPELLPLVFNLFTQADDSLARTQGGLGIGLALVRSLVEMHGGRVMASSEGPGRGSEFVVILPALTLPETALVEMVRTDPIPVLSRKVLVVDDIEDSAHSLARLLGRMRHRVEVAHTGAEGIAKVREFRPEVLLLDLGLPDLDGCQVADYLRSVEPEIRPRLVVAVTGYGSAEDLARTRDAGFDFHLVKPVDPARLRELLTRGSRAEPESA